MSVIFVLEFIKNLKSAKIQKSLEIKTLFVKMLIRFCVFLKKDFNI